MTIGIANQSSGIGAVSVGASELLVELILLALLALAVWAAFKMLRRAFKKD